MLHGGKDGFTQEKDQDLEAVPTLMPMPCCHGQSGSIDPIACSYCSHGRQRRSFKNNITSFTTAGLLACSRGSFHTTFRHRFDPNSGIYPYPRLPHVIPTPSISLLSSPKWLLR